MVRTLAATLGVLECELASIEDELLTRLEDAAGILLIMVLDVGESSGESRVVIFGDVDIGNASMRLKESRQVTWTSGVLESADVERDRVVLSVAWWHGLSLGSVVGWLVGSLVG